MYPVPRRFIQRCFGIVIIYGDLWYSMKLTINDCQDWVDRGDMEDDSELSAIRCIRPGDIKGYQFIRISPGDIVARGDLVGSLG